MGCAIKIELEPGTNPECIAGYPGTAYFPLNEDNFMFISSKLIGVLPVLIKRHYLASQCDDRFCRPLGR